ncbi:Basic-leucine zipper domain-containing protein [Dioscorea alata]|uniref:Basic-leucine zipper domain-containing protein n=1 Tax=Dioscorea alata TaxID=55571 RepID=A0ACB7WA90_DIOAL|nr:Basic-leucine zipper domain-containing protein [Dioscorea alata]
MAEVDGVEDFDLEALLRDFDEVPSLDLSDISLFDFPSPEEQSLSPADSNSSWAEELEKFLLENDDGGAETPEVQEGFENNFFSDILGSNDGNSDNEKEEVSGLNDGKSDEDEKKDGASGLDDGESDDDEKKDRVSGLDGGKNGEIEKKDESFVVVDEGEDDSIMKKRRRQMRNKDSAMKSRERKKMYVKDLEMKSKYLESECRRLKYAFQCCIAENLALRQCLQNGRAFGAPAARQESAVLFMESLLLGSLFWLMSIVCLFLAPGLPSLNQKGASRPESDPVLEVQKIENKGAEYDFGYHLIILRRYRGMRSRMKSSYYYPCSYGVVIGRSLSSVLDF